MAWHKGKYYVRKHWEAGRCVSEYIGGGDLGQIAADLDAAEQAERKRAAAARRRAREQERALDAQVIEAADLARALARAVLLASGYHDHKGQWRRRREQTAGRDKARESGNLRDAEAG